MYADGVPQGSRPRLPLTILAAIAGFSIVAVYCTFVSIHTIDVGTGAVAANESMKQYTQALSGARDFPYQWRLLGIYLVFAGERITGAAPHTVDVVLKTLLLTLSSTVLFLFGRLYTSEIGALCAVAFYQLATVAGFADQYTIYFTNDYAVITCWFAAVYLIRTGRHDAAAAVTFVGAFAKETMVLVPVLVGFRWLRGQASFRQLVVAAAAFAVPTVVLRWWYPAPVSKWAWWDMVYANVPFLQSSVSALVMTLKNNLKVAVLYNVFWIVAARAAIRSSSDLFARDLALTGIVYVLIAYPVIYIRELRHFLPLAIVVLPLAIAEIERRVPSATLREPL